MNAQTQHTPGRFPWQLKRAAKHSPDFHDAKVALMTDAAKHPGVSRSEARVRVCAVMRDLRAQYPGVIWGSFPARLMKAVQA